MPTSKIELGGSLHYEPDYQERDRLRDAELNSLGFTVMRFSNDEVYFEIEAAMGEGNAEQAGRFISATLKPKVQISDESDAAKALALHEKAHYACFIANSLSFPVKCEATIEQVK